LEPQHLEVKDWERSFMKKLFNLMPSPRAAKRFVNIYRLIRAGVDTDRFEAFVGDGKTGEYRTVLILLGLVTGYPVQASAILNDLTKQRPSVRWWDFVSGYPVDPRPGEDDALEPERWRQLLSLLETLRPLIPEEQSCSDFIQWAPLVARYSFQSGRLLARSKEEPVVPLENRTHLHENAFQADAPATQHFSPKQA
jgi:hypothetical protein